MSLKVYWAGPLFTQAERIWNRRCAAVMTQRGYDVTLPQDEAQQFITENGPDLAAIAELCYRQVNECDVVVAVLDGADADSGTSLEVGLKISRRRETNENSIIIGVRTDFRQSEQDGVNGMFRLLDDIVPFPSFNEDLDALCEAIDAAIRARMG